MRIPIPTSSPPARSHRSLVQEQPRARDAPRTGGGAIASARASQPSQHLRKWWLLPLSSPVSSFHAGCGLASLSERLPLLLARCASKLRFSSLRPLSKVSSPSAISPKADLQGGVGNFVWSSTSITTKVASWNETRPNQGTRV